MRYGNARKNYGSIKKKCGLHLQVTVPHHVKFYTALGALADADLKEAVPHFPNSKTAIAALKRCGKLTGSHPILEAVPELVDAERATAMLKQTLLPAHDERHYSSKDLKEALHEVLRVWGFNAEKGAMHQGGWWHPSSDHTEFRSVNIPNVISEIPQARLVLKSAGLHSMAALFPDIKAIKQETLALQIGRSAQRR